MYLHELFFAFYFHLSKDLFLMLKNNEVADLTHLQYRSKVWTHFFSFFKTAVEIGPVG